MTQDQAHELCEEYADEFRCLKKKDDQPNKDGIKAFALFRRISYERGIAIVAELKRWDPTDPRAKWSKPNAGSLLRRLQDAAEAQRIPTWLSQFKHGSMISFINRPGEFGIIDKETSDPVILVPRLTEDQGTFVVAISAADINRKAFDHISADEYEANKEYVLSRDFGAYFTEWFRFLLDPRFASSEMEAMA